MHACTCMYMYMHILLIRYARYTHILAIHEQFHIRTAGMIDKPEHSKQIIFIIISLKILVWISVGTLHVVHERTDCMYALFK